jgi:hypothetical protein
VPSTSRPRRERRQPGQILTAVANAADKAGIPVEEVGVRMMRGVDEPLALYRVKHA